MENIRPFPKRHGGADSGGNGNGLVPDLPGQLCPFAVAREKSQVSNLAILRRYDLVYLATPYTKYRDGIQVAFEHACKLAARLVVLKLNVYSPIAHTHPIAVCGELNPLNHFLWLDFDKAMVRAASALLIARMDGWRKSYGIAQEEKWFRQAGKPIYWIDPITLEVT